MVAGLLFAAAALTGCETSTVVHPSDYPGYVYRETREVVHERGDGPRYRRDYVGYPVRHIRRDYVRRSRAACPPSHYGVVLGHSAIAPAGEIRARTEPPMILMDRDPRPISL